MQMAERAGKVAESGVKWLQDSINKYNPMANLFFDPVRWKALVDVAILGTLFIRSGNQAFDSFLRRIADFVGELLQEGVMEDFALCNAFRFNECLYLLYFYSHHLNVEIPKPLVTKLIQHPYACKMERLPHQMLALRTALEALGVTYPLPEVRSLYHRTVFAKKPYPWRLSCSDVERLWITVWALMLSDSLGSYPWYPKGREHLRWMINNLFWRMWFEQRLVAACKLIICAYLMGIIRNPFAWEAIVVLLEAHQRSDGSLVDPTAEEGEPDQRCPGILGTPLGTAAALLVKEVGSNDNFSHSSLGRGL